MQQPVNLLESSGAMIFHATDQPFLSVIVSVYNKQDSLSRCLDSLLDCPVALEIIIVDDDSSDDSRSIAQAYVDQYQNCKLICLTKNCGAGEARNVGAKHARGQYLAFFDADDWCENAVLSTLYDQLAEHSFPDIAVTGYKKYCHHDYQSNYTFHTRYLGLHTGVQAVELRLAKVICPSPWNKLYKTSYWQNHKLAWPEMRHSEDFASILEFLAEAESVLISNQAYYCYNVNEGSLTRSLKADKIDHMLTALEHMRIRSSSIKHADLIDNFDNKLNRVCYAHLRYFLNINAASISRDALIYLCSRLIQFNLDHAVPYRFFVKEFDGYKFLKLLRQVQTQHKLAYNILEHYSTLEQLKINTFVLSPIKLRVWKKRSPTRYPN